MNIHPVSEAQATGKTRDIFREIKDVFSLHSVPLLFQYLGANERYLIFIWDRIKENIKSIQFQDKQEKLVSFSSRSIGKIYTPTPGIISYAGKFSPSEKEELSETIDSLVSLNSTLLLISFAIRESIKGIPLEQLLIEEKKDIIRKLEKLDEKSSELQSSDSLDSFETMLSLVGQESSLITPPYTQFFEIAGQEVRGLSEKESYLAIRVGLEQIAQLSIQTFPYPMHSSYRELADMIPDMEMLYELLYILKHRFPSLFPHQLLTSSVMKKILREESGLVAI